MLLMLILGIQPMVWGQADYPWLRFGDQFYQQGTYNDAETAYRKALEEKQKPTTAYNLGNTIYHQNRMPEAIQQYQQSIETTKDPQLKAKSYYNLGNAHYENKEFDKSIEAYKESLKLQPADEDAKKNLMLAMRQLQQQQKQQQQQDQQQNKDQSEENKDQQQQDQKDKNDPQQQDKSSPQQSQAQQDDKKQQQSGEKVSEDEAREILKAIEREDQRVQEKLKKPAGKTAPPVKDW